MKNKTIKGFFIGVEGVAELREIEDELSAYYSLLGCSYIEAPQRLVGGVPVLIICDEEARLKDPLPEETAIGTNCFGGHVCESILGNCFLCASDGENFASLDETQIKAIKANLIEDSDTGRKILLYHVK